MRICITSFVTTKDMPRLTRVCLIQNSCDPVISSKEYIYYFHHNSISEINKILQNYDLRQFIDCLWERKSLLMCCSFLHEKLTNKHTCLEYPSLSVDIHYKLCKQCQKTSSKDLHPKLFKCSFILHVDGRITQLPCTDGTRFPERYF